MPDKGLFWNRFLSIGVRPGMGFSERRRLHVLNGAALAGAVLSAGFFLVNLANGRHDLALANFAGAAISGTSLGLIAAGWVRSGTTLLLFGMITAFAVAGYRFRNGVDLYLLLAVSASLLVMDSLFWRRFTATAAGTLFVLIQGYHFAHPDAARVTASRFVVNVAVFAASLYWYNSIFRSIHEEALGTISEKNDELERQRLLLEAEHATLLDRTAELDEANAAKEKLFSIVGHDLRGPVGNVKQSLALLEDGTLSPDEFRELQRGLRRGIDHVHASLENLMEWASTQMESLRPRFAAVPLGEAAAGAVDLLSALAGEKGIELRNGIPADAAVRADAHQLQAIFRNLLSNAIKFTPAGGRVDLLAMPRDGGGAWRVTIRDTGVGMEPERVAALFRPGGDHRSTRGTADEKGLGLGLQICRDFVRAHGGAISAESAPGRGTAFHVVLPAA